MSVVSTPWRIPAYLVVFAAASWPLCAAAHTVGMSRGTYEIEHRTITAELAFAGKELAAAWPALDTDEDGTISAAELDAGQPLLRSSVLPGVQWSAPGGPCAAQLDGAGVEENDGVLLRVRWVCPGSGDAAELEYALPALDALSRGHRHVAKVLTPAARQDIVVHGGAPRFTLTVAEDQTFVADAGGTFAGFVLLGIEHIVFGFDHVVFLLALFLVAGTFREYVFVITAFTVAHSITLAIAVLGFFQPPGDIIEPAIALSIAWVGVENLFIDTVRKRWRITFAFGLIHGFGFAGALAERGFPEGDVPSLLLAFNLGVEGGQLAILALALPLLWAGRRYLARWLTVTRALSVVVVATGLYWFVTRVPLFA